MTLHSQRIKPEVMRAQPAINKIDAAICAFDLYGTLIPMIKLMTTNAKPTAVIRFPTPQPAAAGTKLSPRNSRLLRNARSYLRTVDLNRALNRYYYRSG